MAQVVVRSRPRGRATRSPVRLLRHARTLRPLGLCFGALGVFAIVRDAAAQGAAPYTASQQAPSPPLEAGGLTPPPATEPARAETLQRLQRAEREDAGRGLEFVWLNAEVGYEYLALSALDDGSLLDGDALADSGSALVLGAGAGVRFIVFTLGGRVRLAQLDDVSLWTLNAEVELRFPLGELEPYALLGAGYARLDASSDESARLGFDASSIEASGFDVRAGGGLDWYVNPLLSLGVRGTVELLALSRSASAAASAAGNAVYGSDGDGLGLGLTLTAGAGLHF